MKLLLATALAAFAYAAPRSKRGFGGAPCVVTGNELYINGLYQRNLTSSEQQELSQYQDSLTQYENALQQAIDQHRQDRQNNRQSGRNGRQGGMGGGMDNMGGRGGMGGNQMQNQSTLPQPPQRPSFCSDDAITQYIFDGCMVQDNKVYIGKQYARDLSQTEIQQLQDFDSQMTAYQNYLQQQLQSQVQNLFGQGFLSQFGENGGSSTVPSTTGATSSPGPAPQAPTAPNFCTAIY